MFKLLSRNNLIKLNYPNIHLLITKQILIANYLKIHGNTSRNVAISHNNP